MQKIMIGLRAYLTGDNQDELELQASDAKKYFPNASLIVALRGRRASETVKSFADEIIHYSSIPLGLTLPLYLLIEHAKNCDFDQLILTDGDSQFPFSEIRRIYDDLKDICDAIIPKRKSKTIFFSDNNSIGRLTLEDLENAFIRIKQGCWLEDPQPGLMIFLNKRVFKDLELKEVPSMIGDLAITSQLLRKGYRIKETMIETRVQRKTRVNSDLEFKKVSQLERYFNFYFLDVLNNVEQNPDKFLKHGKLPEIMRIKNYIESMGWH